MQDSRFEPTPDFGGTISGGAVVAFGPGNNRQVVPHLRKQVQNQVAHGTAGTLSNKVAVLLGWRPCAMNRYDGLPNPVPQTSSLPRRRKSTRERGTEPTGERGLPSRDVVARPPCRLIVSLTCYLLCPSCYSYFCRMEKRGSRSSSRCNPSSRLVWGAKPNFSPATVRSATIRGTPPLSP